jgi:NAD(P)-dependent dehydrogenase (short-subunit alcohol dehydrogenase family)
VLVNNAGGVISRGSLTPDGMERTFALNHLAPFLLTQLLLPTLQASAPARIVNLTTDVRRAAKAFRKIDFDAIARVPEKYSALGAYMRAKVAVVAYSYELARQLAGTGVTVNVVHPGVVRTGFGRDATGMMRFIVMISRLFDITPEKGADTPLYLATSPDVEGVTGRYFYKRHEVRSPPETYDPAFAQQIWQGSARLVGVAAPRA